MNMRDGIQQKWKGDDGNINDFLYSWQKASVQGFSYLCKYTPKFYILDFDFE